MSVILAQVGNETGWGTSSAWTKNHNPAGIALTGPGVKGNGYPNINAAFADYANKLQGIGEAGQQGVMNAVRMGAGAFAVAQQLEASPWAAGHYGGNGLENIMRTYNLTQYDFKPAPSKAK